MDFVNACRLCMWKGDAMVPIFVKDKVISIASMINKCLPIEVSDTDNLPKEVCSRCVQRLFETYEFCNMVSRADNMLRTYAELEKRHTKLEKPKKSFVLGTKAMRIQNNGIRQQLSRPDPHQNQVPVTTSIAVSKTDEAVTSTVDRVDPPEKRIEMIDISSASDEELHDPNDHGKEFENLEDFGVAKQTLEVEKQKQQEQLTKESTTVPPASSVQDSVTIQNLTQALPVIRGKDTQTKSHEHSTKESGTDCVTGSTQDTVIHRTVPRTSLPDKKQETKTNSQEQPTNHSNTVPAGNSVQDIGSYIHTNSESQKQATKEQDVTRMIVNGCHELSASSNLALSPSSSVAHHNQQVMDPRTEAVAAVSKQPFPEVKRNKSRITSQAASLPEDSVADNQFPVTSEVTEKTTSLKSQEAVPRHNKYAKPGHHHDESKILKQLLATSVPPAITCRYCKKPFTSKLLLSLHMMNTCVFHAHHSYTRHTKLGKEVTEEQLMRSAYVHLERVPACYYCKRVFASKRSLQSHLHRYHAGSPSFRTRNRSREVSSTRLQRQASVSDETTILEALGLCKNVITA